MMKASTEKGYPWILFEMSRSRMLNLLVTALLIGLAIAIAAWSIRFSGDATPDSITGYGFAFAGTTFMLLAAIRYSLYRRSRKRGVGKLNASLHWHISFGVIGLILLCLHSFGNLNPRTGTYALWGMVALVISGIVGRTLDRLMPKMIAAEVGKALTIQGEDRIESITQELQSIVVHNQQEVRSFKADNPHSMLDSSFGTPNPWNNQAKSTAKLSPTALGDTRGGSGQVLQTSWDLAYISLEETPQELNRSAQQYRFVPDKRSVLSRPGALIPGAQEHMTDLRMVDRALQREQFLRHVIRYWRICHIGLALTTIGLTLWHIEFALSLLIPVWLHQ